MVVAGYSTGGVSFFDGRNGTVLGSAGGNNAVLAIERSGQVIANNCRRRCDARTVRAVPLSTVERRPLPYSAEAIYFYTCTRIIDSRGCARWVSVLSTYPSMHSP